MPAITWRRWIMRRGARGLAVALALLLPAAVRARQPPPAASHDPPAAAPAPDAPPRCDAAHEGITACFANVLCICRFHPGDAARKLPDRFAWDCGITRPQCALPPADLTPIDPYAVPPVIVDVDHPAGERREDREPESAPPQP